MIDRIQTIILLKLFTYFTVLMPGKRQLIGRGNYGSEFKNMWPVVAWVTWDVTVD